MTKTESKPAASPEDLLRAAVAGKAETATETAAIKMEGAGKAGTEPRPTPPAAAFARAVSALSILPARLRTEARVLGVAGAALAVGVTLGAGVAALSRPGQVPNDAVAAMSATVDAGRIETARLSGEIARVQQALADLRTATDAARKEAAARGTALGERLGQVDRTVVQKLASLNDHFDQSQREQSTRIAGLAAQVEKRAVTPTPMAATKPEPTQTGSLAEPKGLDVKSAEFRHADKTTADVKPAEAKASDAKAADTKPKSVGDKPVAEKPVVLDGWALRDVFEGAAILENRRRRIVEVGPGDTLPGVGRVEAVERRGRDWVVVTRQGLVTAQPW